MSWDRVDTMRCASCRVFAPVAEILYAPNGTAHCVACGVPADVDLGAIPSERAREREEGEGYRPPYAVVAAVVGVTNLLFFVAAWVSQL